MTNNNLTLFGKEEPVNKKKKDSFSYSKIALFLECPLRYKYAYIDNVKHKYQNTFYLNVGRSMHNTLKYFFDLLDKNDRNSEILAKLLKFFWDDSNFKTLDESNYWYDIMSNSLYRYLDIDKTYCSNVENLEEQFFKFELGDNILNGKIDRIDMISKNEIELIDYKTGDFSGNLVENIKNDFQWGFYFLGSKYLTFNKKSNKQKEKDEEVRSFLSSLLGKPVIPKKNSNIILKFLKKEL